VRLVDGQYRIVRDSGVYASRSASDPSAREVGRALDAATASEGSLNAAARSVIGAVDSQTSARAVTAVLKKLSPEVYGYADAASIRMHREVTRTLARRMREQPLDGETPDGELAARDWKGFVMPYGERFIGNAQGRSSSTRSTSGGILAGLEKTDHRGLTLGLHAGVGGRHQSVSTWHDARVNSGGVFAGVHGQFAPEGLDGFYVTGSARVGLEENRSKRTVAFGSYYQKARGSYTSWTMEAMAGLGKDWKAGAVTFGPFASLEYIRTEHGSFKEKRAEGAGLSVRKGSNDALGAMLGAHAGVASRAEDGLIVRADLSAAYRRELLSTDYTAKASFREIAGSDSFTGHARAMGRNAVIVDGTVGIANRTDTLRVELTAGYEGANTGNSVRFGIRGQYRF
jgi:outer membrane autotransporter protein